MECYLLKILQSIAQDRCWCISKSGQVKVKVDVTEEVPSGIMSLPHGYGFTYSDHSVETMGPLVNLLTSTEDCDPLAKTPFHKNVRVRLEKVLEEAS